MKNWQAQLGFFGILAWMASFQLSDWLMKNGHKDLAYGVYGYILGFITVFAGQIFWGRILQGKWDEYFGGGLFVRAISAISLLIVFAMGCFGVYTTFLANPVLYTVMYIIGGIVVNQGLMAIVGHFDKA